MSNESSTKIEASKFPNLETHWTQSVAESTDLRTLDLYEGDDEKDRVYQAKIRILNHAIQEIGMGKYQVCTVV